MALFKKNKKRDEKKVSSLPSIPQLPEIPRLPEIPGLEDEDEIRRIPYKLPSYPPTSIGNKFSQNTIKNAISGKRDSLEEEDIENFENFKEIPSSSRPALKPKAEEGSVEPVFIRIDKFEKSMKIFEKAREQISQMEKMLSEINQIKEEENKELLRWEKEIQSIKKEIEEINRDVFSKIE
jgi:hypothetical protein